MQRLILFLFISVLIGCSSGKLNKKEISFLTLKGPSAMGMIYLIDSPTKIISEPINIEIIDEPMLVRAKLLKNKPELAVLPLNMAAILYNKGLPYQVIAIPVWGTLYLFGSDSTTIDWQTLKNKRIYMMGKGTTPDILFRYLLKFHKLNPDIDVILDYSFPTHIDLANAVSAGHAQIAVISEPMVSLAKSINPFIKEIMDLNKEWSEAFPENRSMPQTALVGRADFIRNHPQWIETISNAWIKSIEKVNNHPEKAAERIVFHGILPNENAATKSIPRCSLRFKYASDLRPEINQYLQVLYTFNPNTVGGKLPDEQFISQKPLN
jgi:NitT/TauT family transport system substrate-binding protein